MRRLHLCFVALALVAAGCGELLDPAAAVVGGEKITVAEIDRELDEFENQTDFEQLAAQGDANEIKQQVEQQILSEAIRRAVLQPKAEELEVEVTEDEIAEGIDRVKADFESEGAFQEALKEQGLTLDRLEQLVADDLLEVQLREEVTADVAPSPEEIEAYYEESADRFTRTEASHILVEQRARANEISQQLQSARTNVVVEDLFARLARRFSTDPSAQNGGELGEFAPGDFVPEFEEAAAALEIGEVSDPVRTEFGWHVIMVTDRTLAPLEEVTEQIEQELASGQVEEAWNAFLRQAYEEADIKVNPRYGEFDEETFQVVDPSAEDVPNAEIPDQTPGLQPEASPTPAS